MYIASILYIYIYTHLVYIIPKGLVLTILLCYPSNRLKVYPSNRLKVYPIVLTILLCYPSLLYIYIYIYIYTFCVYYT